MGKLSTFLAQRKDLEFEFQREARAVRDLLRGVHQIGGRDQTLSLMPGGEGFVAEGQARAILINELQLALRDVLIRYLHNLCFEGGRLGLEASLFEEALRSDLAIESQEPAPVALTTATVTSITAANSDAASQQAPAGGWQARQLQDALAAAQAAAQAAVAA